DRRGEACWRGGVGAVEHQRAGTAGKRDGDGVGDDATGLERAAVGDADRAATGKVQIANDRERALEGVQDVAGNDQIAAGYVNDRQRRAKRIVIAKSQSRY